MISTSDREKAVKLIREAVAAGCRLSKACSELGLTERTYYRWMRRRKQSGNLGDGRPGAVHPEPKNKLSQSERQRIVDICNSSDYSSMPPCEIVPALADKGTYLASESSFYRILRDANEQHHRGRADKPVHRTVTTHVATEPNQVWMWDITYLNGPVKGQFYYLYLISDLFSRDIVGWKVWEEQTDEMASVLIRRTCLKQQRLSTHPLVLYSDNGSPMKGANMLETLYKLGIKFVTLFQRHSGEADRIVEKRHELYEQAKAAHPERWNGRPTRDWTLPDKVYLNPDREDGQTTINDQNR